MTGKPVDLNDRNMEALGLSPEARRVIADIKAEVDEAYRDRFLEMVQALALQAATLDRIQTTLAILVEKVAPEFKDRVPVAFRLAADDEEPDVATALVTADPIGAGFTLSQADVARAARVSEADASLLIRGYGLRDDPDFAIQVRRGKSGSALYNYHPRTVDRLLDLIRVPPADRRLTRQHSQALSRARRTLGIK